MYKTIINNSVEIEWNRLVILIKTDNYFYEVDPEQRTLIEWLNHLREKNWFNIEMEEGLRDAFVLIIQLERSLTNFKAKRIKALKKSRKVQ